MVLLLALASTGASAVDLADEVGGGPGGVMDSNGWSAAVDVPRRVALALPAVALLASANEPLVWLCMYVRWGGQMPKGPLAKGALGHIVVV